MMASGGAAGPRRSRDARSHRFIGDSSSVTFPEDMKKVAKCLQPGFKPTKTVADECREHRLAEPSDQGDERLTALMKYTEDDMYRDLNEKMRQYAHKEWENTIHYMYTGMGMMPRTPGRPPILWRGFSQMVKLTKGQTIVFKDFTSCSKKQDVALGFAGGSGVLFQIHTWKNGADISSISVYPTEDEVLLAPYSKFKVTDIKVSKKIPIVILDAC